MTFKTRNLLAGAFAISMLATTASVWAQSTPAAVTAGPAAAASAPAAKDMLAAFVKADANKDGKLTRAEAEGVPGLATKFEMVDTDNDGMVSKAEFDKALR